MPSGAYTTRGRYRYNFHGKEKTWRLDLHIFFYKLLVVNTSLTVPALLSDLFIVFLRISWLKMKVVPARIGPVGKGISCTFIPFGLYIVGPSFTQC